MSRKLPDELAPVMARTGQQWPEADEDGLRQAAQVWREFGTDAEQLARRGGDSAQRVISENSGQAVDAFADHWRNFTGGGKGYLDDVQAASELVAKAFESAATAADTCKSGIVSVLTELEAELRKTDAAKANAAKQAASGQGGLTGLVGQVVGTVKEGADQAVEAGQIEMAKHRIAELLEELGRAMKHGLQQALDEPAVVTLGRMGGVQPGARGESHEVNAVAGTMAGLGAAGVAFGGGRTLAQVGDLKVALDSNGKPKYDGDGNPIVLGPDGHRVKGLEGVTLSEQDGKQVLLGANGQPLVGLALDQKGKPLKGPDGQPVVLDASGKLAGTDISVAMADGKPVTGPDGTPQLLDANHNPLGVGPDGRPARDGLLDTGRGLGLGIGSGGLGLGLGSDGRSPLAADAAIGPGGPALDATLNTGGTEAQAGGGRSFGGGGYGSPGGGYGHQHAVDASYGNGPAGYSRGDSGGYSGGYSGSDSSSGDYSSPGPLSHSGGGHVYVHTDSVAVAPPQLDQGPDPFAGPGGGGDGGGGGWHSEGSPAGGPAAGGFGGLGGFSDGGSLGGGAASSAPVGTGPVGTGPVGGVPVSGPVGTGPVGTGPMGSGPMAGPSAGPGGGPGGGFSGAGGAPVTPVAPGTPGAAGAVIGVGGHGSGDRPYAGAPLFRTPGGPVAGPGGAAQFPGGPEAGFLIGRAVTPSGVPVEAVQLGAAAATVGEAEAVYLVAHAYGRRGTAGAAGPGAPLPATAGSRPYGLPGGLGPVDLADQAELVRRLPHTGNGVPVPHPDPRAGDWTEAMNGGGHRCPGRGNNSLDIALSAVDTFAGRPTCAAPRLPDGPAGERGGRDRAERELGTRFRDLGDGAGALGKLSEVLRRSGPGCQAVLLTVDEYGRSHAWNAVNHGGKVTYLDHLTGRQSSGPLHGADHGLWAIAVDQDCRPIDLSGAQLPLAAPAVLPVPEPAEAAEAAEAEAAEAAEATVAEPTAAPAPEAARTRLTVHRPAEKSGTRSSHR